MRQQQQQQRLIEASQLACPFERLGLKPGADAAAVRAAFRRAALVLHPDKTQVTAHPGASEQPLEAYHRMQIAQTEALATLQQQDEENHKAPSDVVNNEVELPPGPPIMVNTTVPARLLYTGGPYVVSATVRVMCTACTGTGAGSPQDVLVCLACQGAGEAAGGAPCDSCGSAGVCFLTGTRRRCRACGGRGATDQVQETTVPVPAGFTDGARVRVPGAGGWAGLGRRSPSDLVVVLRRDALPAGHTACSMSGDVTVTVPLHLGDVLCGYQLDVPVFNGATRVRVHQLGYARPDRAVTFPGMGLPCRGTGRRGLLRVRFCVAYPPDAQDGYDVDEAKAQAEAEEEAATRRRALGARPAPLLPMHRLQHIWARLFPSKK